MPPTPPSMLALARSTPKRNTAPEGLSIEHSTALRANATDAPMHFGGGCDFTSLIGTRVSFEVHMARARLYTIGFEPARAGHASNNRHSSAKEHAAESSASEKNSCHPRHGGASTKEGHGSHGGGHGREHLVVEESSTKRAQEQ